MLHITCRVDSSVGSGLFSTKFIVMDTCKTARDQIRWYFASASSDLLPINLFVLLIIDLVHKRSNFIRSENYQFQINF